MSNLGPILEVEDLRHAFDGVFALQGISFNVRRGELFAIIGPNGAGKTTLFNIVTGVIPLQHGVIKFQGLDISKKSAHYIASLGIARTFQHPHLFPRWTVLENVMVGGLQKCRSGFWQCILRLPDARSEELLLRRRALKALDVLGISDLADSLAEELTAGQQRLMEIARALVTEPKLLLLDEPAAGLSGDETYDLAVRLRELISSGLSVLLIEHDTSLVFSSADRVMVLDSGRQLVVGSPAEVSDHPEVIAAYLGQGVRSDA